MVTIRLARHGSKKHPFYHINVADRAAGRNGRFVERLGFYNPVARGTEEVLRIDLDRVQYWLSVGAQPTDKVKRLVARMRRAASPAAAA
jgi:small subunit ribosomal protein S16